MLAFLDRSHLMGLLVLVLTHGANEGKSLTITQVPDLLRSKISKPLLAIFRQVGNALILTGSNNDVTIVNVQLYEFIESVL